MTTQQTQKVRRQLRADLKKQFSASLKALRADDLERIFERAIANRQVAGREA